MKKLVIISFVLVGFAACTKDLSSNTFTPYPNLAINDTAWVGSGVNTGIQDTLANILDTLGVAVDSFDCTQGKLVKLNGDDDLQLNFPPFNYQGGGGPYQNFVRVELLILKKKGDFIRVLSHTKNIEKPLEGSYCFYVRLTNKQGQEILMPPGINYSINWKDSNADRNMIFFEGLAVKGPDTLMNWMPSYRGTIHQTFQPGSSTSIKGYEIVTGTTSWIGGLKYSDTSSGTANITIGFNSLNFTNKNTVAYAVLKDTKTVIRLTSDNINKTFYCNKVPKGVRVTIVTISLIDNQFFLGTIDETVNATNIFKITPVKKTINDIHSFLDNL